MNTLIEKGLRANPNMKLNDNEEHVNKILLGLEKKKLHSFKKAGYKDLNDLDKIYAKMQSYCDKFPDTDKNIVIAGSVGTGKSYLAQIIHKISLRSNKPFFSLNMA